MNKQNHYYYVLSYRMRFSNGRFSSVIHYRVPVRNFSCAQYLHDEHVRLGDRILSESVVSDR